MNTECKPKQFEFHALGRREVVGCFDSGRITSDAGGLLLREVDTRIGLMRRLATLVGKIDVTGQKRIRDRDKGCPLASSSTLNRLELSVSGSAARDHYKRIAADPDALDQSVPVQRQYGRTSCGCTSPRSPTC